MKIGLFGGSFDPPHHGHLIVARHVREALGLDHVLLVPANRSPHKLDRTPAHGQHRLAMVHLAVAGDPGFAVSDVEVARGGISYTVDTLRHLRSGGPGHELFFLLGIDNAADFLLWREPEEILRLSTVVLMSRAGFGGSAPGVLGDPSVIHVDVPLIDIRSRDLRARIRGGKSIRYLVPDAVERYILSEGLYES